MSLSDSAPSGIVTNEVLNHEVDSALHTVDGDIASACHVVADKYSVSFSRVFSAYRRFVSAGRKSTQNCLSDLWN